MFRGIVSLVLQKKVLILGETSCIRLLSFAKLGFEMAIANMLQSPIDKGVYSDSLSIGPSDIIELQGAVSCAVILLGYTDHKSCASDVHKSQALYAGTVESVTTVSTILTTCLGV